MELYQVGFDGMFGMNSLRADYTEFEISQLIKKDLEENGFRVIDIVYEFIPTFRKRHFLGKKELVDIKLRKAIAKVEENVVEEKDDLDVLLEVKEILENAFTKTPNMNESLRIIRQYLKQRGSDGE